MRHHRHQRWAGPWMVVNDVMIFAIDAAVDRINKAIAFCAAGMLQNRRREDALAARTEDYIDRVVHAAGHDRLNPGAIGLAAKNVGGARHQWRFTGPFIRLLGKGPLAPINPAIRTEIGTV